VKEPTQLPTLKHIALLGINAIDRQIQEAGLHHKACMLLQMYIAAAVTHSCSCTLTHLHDVLQLAIKVRVSDGCPAQISQAFLQLLVLSQQVIRG